MLIVRLACDHLFGKLLFTWLSLVMSMMVSFVLSFFPRDVLDEILNLIESVSEDFPSYSLLAIMNGKQINLQPGDPPWLISYYAGMRNIIRAVVQVKPEVICACQAIKI